MLKVTSNLDLKITKAYIKQETDDSKESLKCVLYSPVRMESSSLEITKQESSKCLKESLYREMERKHILYYLILTRYACIALLTGIKNRHYSICNITFRSKKSFLDHELHSHKTKKTPIIDFRTFCCNI